MELDSQSRFQFNSCLLCVCRLVYTRSITKSRFMINMNFSSTELFSDIHLRVFPRNNKVWAHGPMSLKFDGPVL